MRPLILVHGAWHGAWCWATLQAELDRRGVPSYAVDLPGHGASTKPAGDLYSDADHVVDTLARLAWRGPAVLVGHSYGGAVTTEAAVRSTVPLGHLVYVAAIAPDAGETANGTLQAIPVERVRLADAIAPDGNGNLVIRDEIAAAEALYGDCPAEVVTAALSRLDPQPIATFAQAATGNPRPLVSSTYVRCLRDRAIHPDQQAVMSKRCDVPFELDTDHSPFLSMVAELAEILEGIARA